MGGKSLCVTSQHNAPINVVQRHVTLNNGDQGLTMLSTTNSSHTESITSNIKVIITYFCYLQIYKYSMYTRTPFT